MGPRNKENGIALFIALVALSLLSLLGLSVAYNAMTEMQISDNMETGVASLFLAESGAELAREMARGTDFNVLLTGPNLVGNTTNPAGQGFAYRNPMELAAARTLDLDGDVRFVTGGVANDDGVVSFIGLNGMKYRKRAASDFTYYQTSGPDGVFGTGDETTIPAGTPVFADDVTLGRILVKVANNPQELGVTPFQTSLQRVILRVMAVSRTLGEGFAGASRRNSVSVVELVLRRDLAFNLQSPLLVEGDDPKSAKSGKFVTGNAVVTGLQVANVPGIATIDTDLTKHNPPDDIVRDDITKPQNVTGGTTPNPSVEDIRSTFDPVPPVPQSQSDVAAWLAYQQAKDSYNMLDPSFLWKFANDLVPKIANTKIPDKTTLSASNVGVGTGKYDLGYWNLSNPNDPNNRPVIALAEGDLTVS
ncbi:MAG: hypothetical protein HY652_15950, partial [Acidobacteria bacterium]|nr:hypothetical protein [Acidobacteriota bacterium]